VEAISLLGDRLQTYVVNRAQICAVKDNETTARFMSCTCSQHKTHIQHDSKLCSATTDSHSKLDKGIYEWRNRAIRVYDHKDRVLFEVPMVIA